MVNIQQMIDDYNNIKNDLQISKNYCTALFNKLVHQEELNPDVFYSARAMTSIVNTIVNKKIEYVNYLINNQVELLGFLNTYDDNYLSNMQHLLTEKFSTEIIFIQELADDVFELIQFLTDFLSNLPNIKKKNSLPKHLEDEINNIIKECEKKYKEE